MIWTNKYCWIHSVTHTSKRGKILILYMAIDILQYMAILQRSGFFFYKKEIKCLHSDIWTLVVKEGNEKIRQCRIESLNHGISISGSILS